MSGAHPQITRTGVNSVTQSAPAEPLVLRDGAQVVIRVIAAPRAGGQGIISLAGRRLAAELPAGLSAGQRLAVTVEADSQARVLLRIVREARAEGPGDPIARLAGLLALASDGELLQAALLLAGGAVSLPGGSVAGLAVDPDDGAAGAGSTSTARLVLHSPKLGPIEITLSLTEGRIAATVEAEPGRPAELADGARAELADALAAAVRQPATVSVRARPADAERPAPPCPLDWLDVRA